jgi:hypothetical protein
MADIKNDYVISRYDSLKDEYSGTTTATTPYATQRKKKASDAAASDYYGAAVEIRGNVAVISAHGWDEPGYQNMGAIYYHVKSGNSWGDSTEYVLTSSVYQSSPAGNIGTAAGESDTSYRYNALSVYEERIVAGWESWYNGSIYSGQIIVFEHLGGDKWVESHITASTPAANDSYGLSVSTYGNHIAVGAPYNDGKSTNAGKVYILSSGSAGWFEEATLEPEFGSGFYDEQSAYFGVSLHMNSDLLAVGAPGKDKVSVYRSGSLGWVEEEVLTHPSSSSGNRYGSNVAIDGQVLVVGCPNEDTAGTDAGAAFIYTSSSASGWDFVQGILHTTADGVSNVEGSKLGAAVDVDSGNIVIGAPYYDALSGTYAGMDGVAYLYTSGSGGWSRAKTVTPDDQGGHFDPNLGTGVSISGDTLMVGSLNEDGGAVSSGTAYIYEASTTSTIVDTEPNFARGAHSTFNIRKQSRSQYLKTSLK